MDLLLSIVIPVYNSEKYISIAINSLCKQCNGMEEIIIIDDGSNDNTEILCREVSSLYKNIRYIRYEKNRGPSCARNEGINCANGKYIWFIDSDDEIDRSAIKNIEKCINNNEADIFFFSYNERHLKNEGVIEHLLFDKKYELDTIVNKNEFGCCFLKNEFAYAIWNKVYSAKLVKSEKHISFAENIHIAEDVAFNLSCISHCNRIVTCSECIYTYIRREGSITDRSKTERHIQDILNAYIHMKKSIVGNSFIWLAGFYQIAFSRNWNMGISEELKILQDDSELFDSCVDSKCSVGFYTEYYGKRWGIYIYICHLIAYYANKEKYLLCKMFILIGEMVHKIL